MAWQLSSFSSSSPSCPAASATSDAARGRKASTTPGTQSPLVQGSTTPGYLQFKGITTIMVWGRQHSREDAFTPPPFPTFSGHHLHSPPTTSTTNSPPTQPCFSTRVQRQDRQCQQRIKRPPDKPPGSWNPTEDQTPDTLNSLVGTSCLFSSVSTTLVTKLSTRWPFVIQYVDSPPSIFEGGGGRVLQK